MTSEVPADLLAAARTHRFRYELLDVDDQIIGALDGVTGGSLDWSAATTVRSGGSLDVVDVDGIDWLHARVRVWRSVGDREWSRGIFVPAAPVARWVDGVRSWTVELLGKLTLLDRDVQDGWTTVPKGTVITTRVRALLAAAGHTRVAVTDSDATTRSDLVWEPGTTRLRIINDLLEAAGYWSLGVDHDGTFLAAPYVRPADRSPRYDLLDDARGIVVDDFTAERDVYSIPNRVVVTSAATGEDPALVASAQNVDPASPYSIPARGMVVPHVEEGVEVTSQAVLDAYARRRLVELASAGANLSVQHAPIPLDLNDAVRFRRGPAGIDGRYTVQGMTEPLDAHSLMSTTLREVIDL